MNLFLELKANLKKKKKILGRLYNWFFAPHVFFWCLHGSFLPRQNVNKFGLSFSNFVSIFSVFLFDLETVIFPNVTEFMRYMIKWKHQKADSDSDLNQS